MNRIVIAGGAYGERNEYACDQCVTAVAEQYAPNVIRIEKAPPVESRGRVLSENCPQCGMNVA